LNLVRWTLRKSSGLNLEAKHLHPLMMQPKVCRNIEIYTKRSQPFNASSANSSDPPQRQASHQLTHFTFTRSLWSYSPSSATLLSPSPSPSSQHCSFDCSLSSSQPRHWPARLARSSSHFGARRFPSPSSTPSSLPTLSLGGALSPSPPSAPCPPSSPAAALASHSSAIRRWSLEGLRSCLAPC